MLRGMCINYFLRCLCYIIICYPTDSHLPVDWRNISSNGSDQFIGLAPHIKIMFSQFPNVIPKGDPQSNGYDQPHTTNMHTVWNKILSADHLPVWIQSSLRAMYCKWKKELDFFDANINRVAEPKPADCGVCTFCKSKFGVVNGCDKTVLSTAMWSHKHRRRWRAEDWLKSRPDVKCYLGTFRECSPNLIVGLASWFLLCGTRTTFPEMRDHVDRLLPTHSNYCHHGLQKALKLWNTWAMANWQPSYRRYIGLETAFGYYSNTTQQEVIDDVKTWVAGGSVDPAFQTVMYLTVKRLLDMCSRSIDSVSEVDSTTLLNMHHSEGVAAGVRWMYSGPNGQALIVSPSKTHYFHSVDPNRILAIMREPIEYDARCFVKEEPVKRRGVVNTGLITFSKMSPLLNDAEIAMRNHGSFPSQSSPVTLHGRIDPTSTAYSMPMDYSAFDHQFNSCHIKAVFSAFRDYYAVKRDTEYCRLKYDLAASLSEHCYPAIVRIYDEAFPVYGGVLSGWRLTAVLDSLLSFSMVQSLNNSAKAWTGIPILSRMNFTGDDIDMGGKTRSSCVTTGGSLSHIGCQIHPNKTYLTKGRTEYLRHVYDGRLIATYPARVISSICYRKPVSDERRETAAVKIRSNLGNWCKLANRMRYLESDLFVNRLARFAASDCVNGFKCLRYKEVEQWIKTAAIMGGGGLGKSTDYEYTIRNEEKAPVYWSRQHDVGSRTIVPLLFNDPQIKKEVERTEQRFMGIPGYVEDKGARAILGKSEPKSLPHLTGLSVSLPTVFQDPTPIMTGAIPTEYVKSALIAAAKHGGIKTMAEYLLANNAITVMGYIVITSIGNMLPKDVRTALGDLDIERDAGVCQMPQELFSYACDQLNRTLLHWVMRHPKFTINVVESMKRRLAIMYSDIERVQLADRITFSRGGHKYNPVFAC